MPSSRGPERPPLPPGVRRVKGANGREYYYFTNEVGRLRIKGTPGTAEFERSLVEVMRKRPARAPRATFDGVLDRFLQSPEHKGRAPSTRKLRALAIERIRSVLGQFSISAFNRREIRAEIYALRDAMSKTPAMADTCIDVLSRVLTWAYDRGEGIEVNHAQRIQRLVPRGKTRSEIVWTDEQIGKFVAEAKQPEVVNGFLALSYSLARVGDAEAWLWSQYDGQWLVFTPAKTRNSTGVEVHLPVYVLLPFKALLDGLPRVSDHILTNETGKPWRHDYLGAAIRKEAKRIFGEDFDRHVHDLRGTGSTKLIDAGCTDREVGAITGHVTDKARADRARSLSTYIKRTRTQALNAYTKWRLAEFEPKGDNVVLFPRGA